VNREWTLDGVVGLLCGLCDLLWDSSYRAVGLAKAEARQLSKDGQPGFVVARRQRSTLENEDGDEGRGRLGAFSALFAEEGGAAVD
jgi:hypothetical protein